MAIEVTKTKLAIAATLLFVMGLFMSVAAFVILDEMLKHSSKLFEHYSHFCNQIFPFTIAALCALFCITLGVYCLLSRKK